MTSCCVLRDKKGCFDLNSSLFFIIDSAKLMELLLRLCECISLNLDHILQEDTVCQAGIVQCTCRDQTLKGVRVILLPCLSSSWTHVNTARGCPEGKPILSLVKVWMRQTAGSWYGESVLF